MTLPLPTWLTFDCYDTLVEFPIERVTRRILGDRLHGVDQDAFFRDYEALRYHATTHEPYRPYREVMHDTLARITRQYGIPYRDEDGDALVADIPTWGPYPDVPPALTRLRTRCKLAIVSNTDDDIVAANAARIGVPFDRIVTAAQVGAYKPAHAVFDHLLHELGCAPGELLHVAQGFEYDIVPAHALGWNRVWINRYGKTGDPAHGPYVELPDLSPLPSLLAL